MVSSKKYNVIKLSLTPEQILQNPLYNKGSAFTQKERNRFNLHGYLPDHISTLEEQLQRNYQNYTKKRTPLGRYVFLLSLLNRNEILFYQFVERYLEEMLPYIYTPTVGEASLQFSMIFMQQRGLYLSYPLKDRIDTIFKNLPRKNIDVIVVTDGERILGLGDQGIGGMAIPIGKLALYTLFAGVHPMHTLPIFLDLGTNNQKLLKHPLYLGWRSKRIQGKKYDEFLRSFVRSVKRRFPKALLQWEDFAKDNARNLLSTYRDRIVSFNDDIQGTASVALAAVLAASKMIKKPFKKQSIIIFGGGNAGLGIATKLFQALLKEGLSEKEAKQRIFIIDVQGLIHSNQTNIDAYQSFFAQPYSLLKKWKVSLDFISLKDVIENVRPAVLIGVSAQTGAFTKEIVQLMSRYTKRPLIFPLSNPTSKAEAFPEEIIQWSKAKAVVATGSPFKAVQYKNKTFEISQCNNVYIFPGVGLGALVSEAKKITENMFLQAAKVLAAKSPALKKPTASLFPPLRDIRKVSSAIALAVAKTAIEEKVAPKCSTGLLRKKIKERVWIPHYSELKGR